MKPKQVVLIPVTALFFSLVFLLVFHLGMQWPLIPHSDEHQFIAAGALLTRYGLLPYVDFPFFHLPNLVLIYSLIFLFTKHLLLGARVFSVLCAMTSLGLIFYLTKRAFSQSRESFSWLIAAGAVLFLCSNSVFIFTSVRTWNQVFPSLLVIAAFMLHDRFRTDANRGNILLCGICLGVAVGSRITYALVVIPFFAVLFLSPAETLKSKLESVAVFALGGIVACIPTIILFLKAPDQFIFGIFREPLINVNFYQMARFQAGEVYSYISMSEKVWHVLLSMARTPASFIGTILFLLVLFFGAQSLEQGVLRAQYRFKIWFSFFVMFFLWLNAFIIPPDYLQYYYAPIPFLFIVTIYILRSLKKNTGLFYGYLTCLLILLGWSIASAEPQYAFNIDRLLKPAEWNTVRIHKTGEWIKSRTGPGRLLTFLPIYPLEGGMMIYPEFTVGVTAWKMGGFMKGDEAKRFRVVPWDGLEEFLKDKPPVGLLAGVHEWLETPTRQYAQDHAYQAMKLDEVKTLWLPPSRR